MDNFVDRFWAWYGRNKKDLLVIRNFLVITGMFFYMLWLSNDPKNTNGLIIVTSVWIVLMVKS